MSNTGTPQENHKYSLYSRALRHPHAPLIVHTVALASFASAKYILGLPSPLSLGRPSTLRRADIVVCLVRTGLVLSISFIEAPTKFHAASAPRSGLIDVGRHVFTTLNHIESILAAFRTVYILDWTSIPGQLYALLPETIKTLFARADHALWRSQPQAYAHLPLTIPSSSSALSSTLFPAWLPPLIPNIGPDFIILPLQTYFVMPPMIEQAHHTVNGTRDPNAPGISQEEARRRRRRARKSMAAHLVFAGLEVVKVAWLCRHAWTLLVHLAV
ncbi:hypothetical protein BCR44DRAFT_38445 [Catenaria anguillulae PL171]|uniref:Uncharacterized protein n=1 Tax=Catenaria anguillulae PL171 TaxID=765915 RepID=A0A1Y2HRI1_9FUNG|nr:hypothetical protein BCR44DRAFT_38445 [Catenaria anguillulae PL171]